MYRIGRVVICLLLFHVLPGCTTEPQPIIPIIPIEPEPVDTTTHEYAWEYHYFGSSQIASSFFRDVYVSAENDIWMVGYIEPDSTIPSTPHGYTRTFINAIRFDEKKFTSYCMEGMKLNGSVNSVHVYGVTGRDASVLLVGSLGITELYKDTMVFHDLRELSGQWLGHEKITKTKFGNLLLHGGNGFLARIEQDHPTAPIALPRIPLPTEVAVATVTEATENEYYIGCWWMDSSEYHFYHWKDGVLDELKYSMIGPYSRTFCTGLWSSDDFVFGANPPYLYQRSIADTTNWRFIEMNASLGVPAIGVPMAMAGRANNDIFIAGHVGTVIHYNGKSFHQYEEFQDPALDAQFFNVKVTNNRVYLVGKCRVAGQARAVLIIGTRKR